MSRKKCHQKSRIQHQKTPTRTMRETRPRTSRKESHFHLKFREVTDWTDRQGCSMLDDGIDSKSGAWYENSIKKKLKNVSVVEEEKESWTRTFTLDQSYLSLSHPCESAHASSSFRYVIHRVDFLVFSNWLMMFFQQTIPRISHFSCHSSRNKSWSKHRCLKRRATSNNRADKSVESMHIRM